MFDFLKSVGAFILGIGLLIGIILLAYLIIEGGVKVAVYVLPWGQVAAAITFLLMLFVLLPLSFFKKMKGWTSLAFVYGSFVYGIILWLSSLLIAYVLWGVVAVFVGLFLFGVGVVPVAMLAALFNGEWEFSGT